MGLSTIVSHCGPLQLSTLIAHQFPQSCSPSKSIPSPPHSTPPLPRMVQVQVPGTCLLCGQNTKFLSSHFAQTHSTHSFFPRGARCPCGHVASVLDLRKHQDATPLCRLKYRDDATPPPREVPPPSKVVVELPSPRTADWRRQYSHANALLRKREREAIETVTARELPLEQERRREQALHDLRTRDPTQYSRTAAYVLLDDAYGSQPKRTPSEASTYTPSGDEREAHGGGTDSSSSFTSGSKSSAEDTDANPSARRRRALDKRALHRAPGRSASTGRRRASPPGAVDDFSDDSDLFNRDEYDYDVNAAAVDDAGAASDGPEVINLVDSSDEEDTGRRRPGLTPSVHSSQPATSARAAKVDEYCSMCMKVYGTPKELYMHMNKVHDRMHISEDDFTSKKLIACPCGRVCTLRGLTRHREITCTLSEAARKRDAVSGLEARRRALYDVPGAGITGAGGAVYRNASGNRRRSGTCNICNKHMDDLYWHMREHNQQGRHLVPGDVTAEHFEVCRCGKIRGLTKMAQIMHDKFCPYGGPDSRSPVSAHPKPVEPRRPAVLQTAPDKHIGRCNICKREVNDVYQHLRNHSNRRLKPKHITCDTMQICRCGKPKALTEVGLRMHDARGCPYAAGKDSSPDSAPETEPEGGADPPADVVIRYPSGNKKYPGTCNICDRHCTDLYMHVFKSHRNRRLRPGDITCDTLVICRCGKTRGLTERAVEIHNRTCKYAGCPAPPTAPTRLSVTAAVASPSTVAPPNDARGGTCNICRTTVRWLYNHVKDVHAGEVLRPGDITADSWMVCKCGKMHGVTEGAIRKHATSCRLAGGLRLPQASKSTESPSDIERPAKRPCRSESDTASDPEDREPPKDVSVDEEGGPTFAPGPDLTSPLSSPAAGALDDESSDAELASVRERAKGKRRAPATTSEAAAFEVEDEEGLTRVSASSRQKLLASHSHLATSGIEDVAEDEEGWPEPSTRSSQRKDLIPNSVDEDATPSRVKRPRTSRIRDPDDSVTEEESRPTGKRLSTDTVDLLMKRRQYREEHSDSPDGPVEGGDYRPKKKAKKSAKKSEKEIAKGSKQTARKTSRDRRWEAEAERSMSARGESPVPEHVSPRRRVLTRTPAFSVADSDEPASRVASPNVPAVATVTTGDRAARSGPSWAAHNSPPADIEKDAEETEEILTTQSTIPSPRIEVRIKSIKTLPVKNAVKKSVKPQTSSTRMRLSGIDIPPHPKKKEKKRPRHSVPA